MGKSKTKSESQKAKQRSRTMANQIKKYSKLISKFPDSIHVGIWKAKMEKYRGQTKF